MDWVKIVANLVAAGAAAYAATGDLTATLVALGTALVNLFQKPPQDRTPVPERK